MKGLGILEVNEKEYVVLDDSDNEMPDFIFMGGPKMYVARRFSIEGIKSLNGEDVVFKTDQFLTPRWMTIHGDYVINWFPEPTEVDVEDTWVKQEEK